MNFFSSLTLSSVLIMLPTACSFANTPSTKGQLTLSYSDGRTDTSGIDNVNTILRAAGVNVSTLVLPKAATPILEASKKRAITSEESAQLLSMFSLHRGQLLAQIEKAGRKPEAHRGGFLETTEKGGASYPAVYDIKAMTQDTVNYLQDKFGRLHVNSAENGMGIDEVMTIVSGGHWTWFFLLPDNVIGKLTLGHVDIGDKAWRISSSGLVPHGVFLDSTYGLVIAHAHGPKNFTMRYEEPSIKGASVLGTNAWIDFSGKTPKLLK